ncbi:hypothetical protein MSLAZ_0105 [Methanosarcina lacustris Z-7289]|uniref:Archaeal Type IV pilin N-terminal domain-containing protein n=1 Tax=Methanosarcina lacustris Z-7289 TaxID=1434111 RepID=A0A0E3S0A8_9EURY|nr:hypothetical protein [Methanosarcina lacustris]AKB73366.1 hypothetical protein MSLAZ_0105 [Methanosarcina lacustris Z-7289]
MKNRGFKAISSFYRSESGVAVAVAAALLLGIVVAAMTTIQLNYVPVWKEDAEYAHMSDVWQDMARFKSNVDILAAGLEINPNSRLVLNSPVQMGGGDVPFIGGMKTGGTLAVNNDVSGMLIVVKDDQGGEYNSENILFYTGSVSYRPTNIHYVDETYCYENGALIVSRNDRSMMKLSPGIVLENGTGISINLSVRAVTLDGNRGVLASNSIEDMRLTCEGFGALYPNETAVKANITSVDLTIYTENPEAWEKYFENSANEIDLQKGTDYNLSTGTHLVTFSLPKKTRDINFKAYNTMIKIETET